MSTGFSSRSGSGFLRRDGRSGGLRSTVIGAGGAARSVVFGLRSEGASVLLLNRTPSRARLLAEEFGCEWAPLDEEGYKRMRTFADLVVQTTSAGMTPHETEDPSAGYRFTGREIAYDIVYHPAVTRFLGRAREAGCTVIGGEEMLLEQAYRQFFLFTGLPYPPVARHSGSSPSSCRRHPPTFFIPKRNIPSTSPGTDAILKAT